MSNLNRAIEKKTFIMEKLNEYVKKNKFFKTGLPLLLLVIGGPFVIKQFAEVTLKYKTDKQRVTPKELAELGIVMKSNDSITLESEYEKVKKIDIDNWVQIRGPRPWEEDFGENEK